MGNLLLQLELGLVLKLHLGLGAELLQCGAHLRLGAELLLYELLGAEYLLMGACRSLLLVRRQTVCTGLGLHLDLHVAGVAGLCDLGLGDCGDCHGGREG